MEGTTELCQQLIVGFETLQDEYQKLFGQHEALERKLQNAREQYNELAKLYGKDRSTTPPLSLPASPKQSCPVPAQTAPVPTLLMQKSLHDAACKVGQATSAAQRLRSGSKNQLGDVTIHSGPSADIQERPASSMMPSISESPLEQDFTVQGVPSKLGCPFASMAGKKLSSHAASIVSRYNQRGSSLGPAEPAIGGLPSGNASAVSRTTGRGSMGREGTRRGSTNVRDPIKAEICGLSDHSANDRAAAVELPRPVEEAGGVCPIRFLNQHSPEEVATYFEKHKHELPRSHELCVRRYQANEEQIKQLDAKYGNLVSMIQGLGQKHQPMLPFEPAEDAAEQLMESESRDKIAGWAQSVSAQAPQSGPFHVLEDAGNVQRAELYEAGAELDTERRQRFDRPLREIRVGESPSRPWGYNIPAKYLEQPKSETSSQPAHIPPTDAPNPGERQTHGTADLAQEDNTQPPLGCPFGFGQANADTSAHKMEEMNITAPAPPFHESVQRNTADHREGADRGVMQTSPEPPQKEKQPQIVISGPVFIGYSAEDAAKILQQASLGSKV